MDCSIVPLDSRLNVMEFPSEEKVERLAHLLNGKFGSDVLIINMSARLGCPDRADSGYRNTS